jgi:hypothetical protein
MSVVLDDNTANLSILARDLTMTAITKEDINPFLRDKDFSRARRLLEAYLRTRGLDRGQLTWARQKLALSTYKDNELQSETALEKALEILADEDLPTNTDPETLSLAGAIQKRLWEVDGDLRALIRSLGYYERACVAAKSKDKLDAWTYAAINAAFVLDLLASDEARDEHLNGLDTAALRREQAGTYRGKVCEEHGKNSGGD